MIALISKGSVTAYGDICQLTSHAIVRVASLHFDPRQHLPYTTGPLSPRNFCDRDSTQPRNAIPANIGLCLHQPRSVTLSQMAGQLRNMRASVEAPHPGLITSQPLTMPVFSFKCVVEGTIPFLRLHGELRNEIYLLAIEDITTIKLFEDRVVLPPVGSVCKQVRTELRGLYEEELLSNPNAQIEARVVNMNFEPLLRWLDTNDQHYGAWEDETPRVLTIHAVCDGEESEREFWWLEECVSWRSPIPSNERLPRLLLHNLTTTLNGWGEECSRERRGGRWLSQVGESNAISPRLWKSLAGLLPQTSHNRPSLLDRDRR